MMRHKASANGKLKSLAISLEAATRRLKTKYRLQLFCSVLLLAFTALLSVTSVKGGQLAEATWLFNFTSTPLAIRATGRLSFTLFNKSEAVITKYRLGCVQMDSKNHPTVTYGMEIEEQEIAPGKGWGVQAFDNLPERTACQERKSRLTVIAVFFSDSGEWHVGSEHL
jgi:hypothetical protein